MICTHKTMLKSLLKSGAFGEEDFPERQLSESNEIGDACCHTELPSFITKLQGKYRNKSRQLREESAEASRRHKGNIECFQHKLAFSVNTLI